MQIESNNIKNNFQVQKAFQFQTARSCQLTRARKHAYTQIDIQTYTYIMRTFILKNRTMNSNYHW